MPAITAVTEDACVSLNKEPAHVLLTADYRVTKTIWRIWLPANAVSGRLIALSILISNDQQRRAEPDDKPPFLHVSLLPGK